LQWWKILVVPDKGEGMSRELLGPAALGRLFDAGLRVQGLSVGVHSSGGQSGGLSRGVRGALPWDLGFTATLSREGLFSKVGKLFKRELQTGDAEFDGYVFIETESPEPLAAVLADETLRQRILETMQETQAWVKLDGSVVSLEAVSLSDTQVPRAVAHVAAVVERLAAVAAAVGSGKRREPAPYPDLSGHANLLTQGSTDTRFWPS
jgi:hypothetical protein